MAAKELDLGLVRGKDATINGQSAIELVGGKNIDITQSGSTVTVSLDGDVDNGHSTNKSNPHEVTAAQVGAVPTSRTINGKPLTENITLDKDDIGVQYGTTSPKMDGTAAVGTDTKLARADHVHPSDTSKQDKLTGTKGQVVGFNDAGKPTPMYMDDAYSNPNRFGFEINLSESDPAYKVRYLGANAGYEAAHMDFSTGVFDYGDWANAWFIKNLKPCVLNFDGTVAYELNPNDYSKKKDGTASGITSDSLAGNVMVGIPTVWVKVDNSNPARPKFYFAQNKIDDSYHAYAHTDANGNIIPYAYMAAYNGYKESSGSRIRSLSGKTPTRSQTGTDQITATRANNPSGKTCWDMEVLADRQLINLLLILIGKSTDTQKVFGNGNMNGYNNKAPGSDATYGVLNTGTLDNKGLFFGYSADNLAVKVFGIENFWGNIWHRTQGMILANGVLKVKMTRGTHDGSTVNDYNTTGDGYVDTTVRMDGTIGTVNSPTSDPYYTGYIDNMLATKFGLFPNKMSGSATTHFADYVWYRDNGQRFALFGGSSYDGSSCGAFACYLANLVSDSGWSVGASVSCKPAA